MLKMAHFLLSKILDAFVPKNPESGLACDPIQGVQ